MKNNLTTILLFEKDTRLFIANRPKVGTLYPLTPIARAQLSNHFDYPIIKARDHLNTESQEKALLRIQNLEDNIFPILDNYSGLSFSSKETFKGIFHQLSSIVFYIWFLIKDTGPWLIYKDKQWKKFHDLDQIHSVIINIISKSNEGIFEFANMKIPPYSKLNIYFNNLILKRLVKSNCIYVTGNSYGFSSLVKEIKSCHDKLNIVNICDYNISYFIRLIRFLFFYNREAFIAPVSSERVIRATGSYSIDSLFSEISDPVINNVLEIFKATISKAIQYNEAKLPAVEDLFKISKPKLLLAHQMRWFEGALLSEIAKQNKVKTILISHGSHSEQKERIPMVEIRDHANGLLTSKLANITMTQSPSADKLAKNLMPELKRIKNHPIMWAYKRLKRVGKNPSDLNKILHAGTYKIFGSRLWTYENSNEYVYGLKKLVNCVKRLPNTQLIIRLRPSIECDFESLQKLLSPVKNCEIKTSGSFLEDLENADLLISYSSTTIEEALNFRVPVGLFGGSNRYWHLPGSMKIPSENDRKAVYHLKNNNLVDMIFNILKVHKNKPLTDFELGKYCWQDSIPDRKYFVKNMFSY